MTSTPAANEPIFNERGLMDAQIPAEADIQRSLMQPEGKNFSDWLESRVARFATRRYDWDALKFQTQVDARYRRAQMRYMGTGATGVASDSNTVPSAHFTFSTMVIPAGGIGPSHIHYDVEEVFFVLRGKMKIVLLSAVALLSVVSLVAFVPWRSIDKYWHYRGMEAIEEVHHVRDLHVTLLRMLGLDDNKLTFYHGGRFKQLSQIGGQVIEKLVG